MKNKTLKQMERNIEGLCKWAVGENGRGIYDLSELHELFSQSIKDALESCRVEKLNLPKDPTLRLANKEIEKHEQSWNMNTTQYDENVKKFLGEEE